MDAKGLIKALKKEAEKYNERRMIVLSGNRERSYKIVKSFLKKMEGKVALVAYQLDQEIENAEVYHLKDSSKLLGTTYDFLVLDLWHSLQPSDIGKLYGIVRGGGLIFLIVPPLDKWKNMLNKYHYKILTPPYTEDDVRRIFIPWFIKKLEEHDGIAIIEDGIIRKEGFFESKVEEEKSLEIPKRHIFEKEIYEYAITQDQVDFIKLMERLIEKPNPITAIVLRSHRGRGKSSAIGIALPALIESLLEFKKRIRVIVTAPELENVQEIFRFSEKILKEKGYEMRKRDREGLIFDISSDNFTIEYFAPADAVERYADVFVVDEAASIPPNLLLSFLERTNRIVYSSTVHGYEGAGRSFTIRFLQRLKKKRVKIFEFEMFQPVRYSINDPIEKWVFDALLLDAEAAEINVENVDDLVYEKLEIEDLLKDEKKLREYFGILILAHYKNNPNDFAILCDAPNHIARAMSYNGKIVCSMQIAYEGNLRDEDCRSVYYGGKMILGNVIPQLMIRHYREMKYGKYRGMRVVRIAVHPDNFDKGIGSKALENILEEAEKENLDYVGASFGATSKLIRFWLKNGFLPMHISTTRNDVSAEFSVTVMKPLSKEFEEELRTIRKRFMRRFMYWLFESLRDLNSKVALDILDSYEGEHTDLGLNSEEINRLLAYAFDVGLTYRTVKDCLFKMSYNFFLSDKKNVLSRGERMLLLAKNIQCKSWERTAEILDTDEERCKIMMKRTVERLIFEFYGDRDEVLEFQEEVQRIFAERKEEINS